MNTSLALSDAMSDIVSRPKIHRMPALPPAPPSRLAAILPLFKSRPVFLPAMVVLTAAFAVMAVQKQIAGLPGTSHNAPFLPPVIVDASASLPGTDKSDTTLVFASESGTIIGRFARVPSDADQITEIRPISVIDKTAKRELLSIISRIN